MASARLSQSQGRNGSTARKARKPALTLQCRTLPKQWERPKHVRCEERDETRIAGPSASTVRSSTFPPPPPYRAGRPMPGHPWPLAPCHSPCIKPCPVVSDSRTTVVGQCASRKRRADSDNNRCSSV